jgi:hypothetical protein
MWSLTVALSSRYQHKLDLEVQLEDEVLEMMNKRHVDNSNTPSQDLNRNASD